MLISSDHATKKPYESPKLVVFGDLRELTRSKNTTANFDSQGNGRVKQTG